MLNTVSLSSLRDSISSSIELITVLMENTTDDDEREALLTIDEALLQIGTDIDNQELTSRNTAVAALTKKLGKSAAELIAIHQQAVNLKNELDIAQKLISGIEDIIKTVAPTAKKKSGAGTKSAALAASAAAAIAFPEMTAKTEEDAGAPHGIWIWKLGDLDPQYLDILQRCSISRVYLKILDAHSKPSFWKFQCSREIIAQFHSRGIDVWGWGFHYGAADFSEELDAIDSGFKAGITGYVIDMEDAGEIVSRHPAIEALLEAAAKLCPGRLGYTSFGSCALHPQFPWKAFDALCDFAMPQIYYEAFRIGKTDRDTVDACVKAYHDLGLTKPLWPIWSTEPGAKRPASAASLQEFMDEYPGSSIWRAPGADERCEAFNLDYGAHEHIAGEELATSQQLTTPMPLSRVLKTSLVGSDVGALQQNLQNLGFYSGTITNEFDFEHPERIAIVSAAGRGGS